MRRTLVQISLLTLLVFASVTGAFAQSSRLSRAGEVIGNDASSKMSVIQEPMARSDAAFTPVAASQPAVRVTVLGQVSDPGVYEFRNGAPTLLELVTQAGNLTRFCGHEFFVFKANEESLTLDGRKDFKYKFEDGDILLAETSTSYYQSLGHQDQAATLAEIHPVTQIVLLNVLDRPVLLSLPPENANLSYLASLLNQDPTSLPGRVEQIFPPNTSAIPADAIIAPDMIFSGAIMKFDPGAIDQAKLPPLPDPVLVKMSSKVQMASAEAMPSDAGWSREQGSLMVQPVRSKTPAPFAPNLGPASELGTAPESEFSGNPFDDAFAEFEATSDETLNSDVPEMLLPAKEVTETRALLSAQQWRIIVTFVTLMSLFLAAWYIRQRQQKKGLKTFNFVESRISTSPESGSESSAELKNSDNSAETAAEVKIAAEPETAPAAEEIDPQLAEEPAATQAPVDDARDKFLELEHLPDETRTEATGGPTDPPREAHELSSYDAPRNEDFIDQKAYEISIEDLNSGFEMEAFDRVKTPSEKSLEAAASVSKDLPDEETKLEPSQDGAHHVVGGLEQPASWVQQSLLGKPWIQELSHDLDPQQSDVSLEKQAEQPADSPAAEAETEEAKQQTGPKESSGRFAAQQLRIDQAHTLEPRPTARRSVPETSSDQDLDNTTSSSAAAERVAPPSAAANWLKMADHPQQPEENLDHIFQAIMRERKK